jgi:hypothetical protein
MNVPISIRPQRPLAFERFQQELGLFGDDFTTARQLVALLEATAPALSEVDRTQLARLMSSTAHAILCTTDKRV